MDFTYGYGLIVYLSIGISTYLYLESQYTYQEWLDINLSKSHSWINTLATHGAGVLYHVVLWPLAWYLETESN